MTVAQIGNPSAKKNRQVNFNVAYHESDIQLNNWFKENYPDSKVYIFHHSHLLATKINNARRYNTNRINGVCVAILVSPSLPLPQYSYSICSKEDTYSRLIGRVEAKDRLKSQLINNQIILETEDRQYPKVLSQFYRFINKVVLEKAPLPKQEKPDTGVHPLTFAKEAELEILAKSTITAQFEGLLARNIQTIPIYIRRYNNKFYENMYGTFEYICEQQVKNPNEEVDLNSTGGITGLALLFVHNGMTYMAVSSALCHVNDHFDKAIGRKIIYQNFHNQERYEIVKISNIDDYPMDVLKKELIKLFGDQYQVTANHYVGEV